MSINDWIKKHNAKVSEFSAQDAESGERSPGDEPGEAGPLPAGRERVTASFGERLKADWYAKTGRRDKADPEVLAEMERKRDEARAKVQDALQNFREHRAEQQAVSLERQAAKQEKRARTMSSKIGRGNIRAARAATTAEGLRAAAERKRAEATEREPASQATTPPPSGNDVIDQLERLGKLKDQGVLSDEEFQAQKLKLLGN